VHSATDIITALTRSLVGQQSRRRIRSATVRLNSLPVRPPLKTSPHIVREQAVQLLARAEEFARLNAYPEQLRAEVTLGLWNICLPLERYYGVSDSAREYDLTCQLCGIAAAMDRILLADPAKDPPDAATLTERIERFAKQFASLLADC